MGIFSLFGKKDRQQNSSDDKDSARAKRGDAATARSSANSSRTPAAKRDVQAARATAMKIDAIESEMSSEFVKPNTNQMGMTLPGPNTIPAPHHSKAAPATPPIEKAAPVPPPKELPPLEFGSPPAQTMGNTTEFLLEGQTTISDVAAPSSEAAAVIEEAAILFSNNQIELVAEMLRAAIAEDKLGNATLTAWRMLFDLYQVAGKQQEFESLSIEYVNKFETSPPTWAATGQPGAAPVQATSSGGTPMVPFAGKLDAGCTKLLDRVQKLSESHRALRLEFVRVTEVDPVGCGLLLGVLKKLQKSGHDLILVGAPELAKKIRSIVEVGRRDETEDPWLLLLEILRLLNLEKEFEEASIDYCVTFEVSPPAFVPPANKVTTAAAEQAQAMAETNAFMMPTVVEGNIDQLILAIASYSDEHDPAIIDCSRLARADFNAAGRLMAGLAPFCGNGKAVEFHNVNHLVAALFNVMGLPEIARVLPRKQ